MTLPFFYNVGQLLFPQYPNITLALCLLFSFLKKLTPAWNYLEVHPT